LSLVILIGVAIAVTCEVLPQQPGCHSMGNPFDHGYGSRYGHRMGHSVGIENLFRSPAFNVKANTNKLIESYINGNLRKFLNLFSHASVIMDYTPLPAGGVYLGITEILSYFKSWSATVKMENVKCNILFADEATRISAVECLSSGVFKKSGNSFQDLKTLSYIKWKLNRVEGILVVDQDLSKTLSLYQTKTESQIYKLREALFNQSHEQVGQLIADDCKFVLTNAFPRHIVIEELQKLGYRMDGEHQQLHQRKIVQSDAELNKPLHDSTKPSIGRETDIESQPLTLTGKEGSRVLNQLINKYVLDRTYEVKTLYSNDNVVVSAWVLTPRYNMILSDFHDDKGTWVDLGFVITTSKFNEQGLLSSVNVELDRPIEPWSQRFLDNQLMLQRQTLNPTNRT